MSDVDFDLHIGGGSDPEDHDPEDRWTVATLVAGPIRMIGTITVALLAGLPVLLAAVAGAAFSFPAMKLAERWDVRRTARRLEASAKSPGPFQSPAPFSPHSSVTTTPPTWWSWIRRPGLWLLVALASLVALALWVVCLALMVWWFTSGEDITPPPGPFILLVPPVGATMLLFYLLERIA